MQLFKLILALPAIGLLSLALLMQSAGVLVMAVNSTSTSHHHHHKRSCGGYSDNYTEFEQSIFHNLNENHQQRDFITQQIKLHHGHEFREIIQEMSSESANSCANNVDRLFALAQRYSTSNEANVESLLQLLVNNDDNYHAQSSPPADLFSQNINNYHQHHLQSTQPRQQQQHLRIRIHAKRSLAPGAATSVFLEKQAHSPELAGAASTLSRSTFKAEIHTYFYILGSGYQARVQHKHIEMQMRVLNDAYRDAGFGFKLKGFENIARTIMRSSSRGDSGVGGGIISEQFVKTVRSNHDRGLKNFTTLRSVMKGTKLVHIDEDSGRVVIRPKSQLSKILRRDTLNVFITATHLSKKDGASYGISVLPFTLFNPKLASHFVNEYLYNPILKNNPAIYDGVILSESTLPGVPGNMDPLINRGRTLVHEVGHWLGLHHVFEGPPCTFPNDYVLDTRPQFGPTHDEYEEVCKPRERRTCADTGMGWDEETRPETLAKYFPNRDSPVFKAHYKDLNDVYLNHLDYVPDKCSVSFSTQQKERMQAMWTKYRAGAGEEMKARLAAN